MVALIRCLGCALHIPARPHNQRAFKATARSAIAAMSFKDAGNGEWW
jgi:hypothetical protein